MDGGDGQAKGSTRLIIEHLAGSVVCVHWEQNNTVLELAQQQR